MTRRVGISWLPIRWGLFFLFISGLQLLSAQEDGARRYGEGRKYGRELQ